MPFVNRLGQILYRLVRSTELRPRLDARPGVIVDLRYLEHTRTLRLLVIMFELVGFGVFAKSGLNRRAANIADMTVWHSNLRMIWGLPKRSEPWILCTDHRKDYHGKDFQKCIFVCYDYGPQVSLPDGSHFAMPYTMHPQIYVQYRHHEELARFRSLPRKVRGLFAGNSTPGYDSASIREMYGLLSRHKLVSHLIQSGKVQRVSDPLRWQQIAREVHRDAIVVFDQMRVHQRYWLDTVASTDFFFAFPGVVIPLAHNVIEAMAVGTIPVLNYPHWFVPPLVNGENCLAFSSLIDLDRLIERILTMDSREIERLRTGVVKYYEEYLNPTRFMQRLLQSPFQTVTLHVLDESEKAVLRALGSEKQETVV